MDLPKVGEMGEEALGGGGVRFLSLVPSTIFVIVAIIQLLDGFVARFKKREFISSEEYQLRQEIKQLLKEAALLSTPATFAQAAKLRRAAATKEKELLKIQEVHSRGKRVSSGLHGRALMILKAITYIGLSWWFWGVPVAVIPQKLLQPFGKFLSWKAGDSANSLITVGIVPWLVLTTRVSKFLCQKLSSFLPCC